MNLFIDTNVFLSFYHLTSDDLEELRKLSVLIQKGQVKLYLPNQVIDEYRRNRENKISAAMKSLKEQRLNLQFPALCKDYDEFPKLRELQKQYEKEHSSLLGKIANDVEENTLKADKIIDELFGKAEKIPSTEALVSKANVRMSIGNPPGKDGSIGDAICWTALLEKIPSEEDLYLIADDGDYYSVLDENKPKEFLVKEWKELKESEVIFYRRISQFFKEHYPQIKLANELEKEILVKNLIASTAFATTHGAIAKLNKLEGFSTSQVNEIASAALTNSQINWIIGDSDVHEFLTTLIKNNKDKLTEDNLTALTAELDKHAPDIDDNEIPF